MTKSKRRGTILDRLERRFKKYEINNFSRVIIGICLIGTFISLVIPDFYFAYLSLNFAEILRGQVWRIFTFILYPPVALSGPTDILWVALELYVYYIIGNAIENTIGAFRFNCYYYLGVFFVVVGNLIMYLLFGNKIYGLLMAMANAADVAYINRSMLFLFALLYPNVQFLLFFIIPVKAKWIAYIDAVFIGVAFVSDMYKGISVLNQGYGLSYAVIYFSVAISILLTVLNFFIFFIEMKKKARVPYRQRKASREYKKKVEVANSQNTRHKCCICGRTEDDDPNLQFRYCSKCSGNKEYCSDHLFTHQHN